MPTWEELVAGDNWGFPGESLDDVTLVSRVQHRLDEELKAFGYSREDAVRDLELAYYDLSVGSMSGDHFVSPCGSTTFLSERC